MNESLVTEKLKEKFGEDIISSEVLYDMLTLTVTKEKIIDILKFLYNDDVLQFRFLTTLCGVHYPNAEKDKTYSVGYHLHSFTNNLRIRIKIFFSEEKPEVPTATTIFATANWMERETFDFYGIKFIGHPNLKRILNMEDMVPFPMRKEFPLEDQTREDKEDAMFGR